MFKDTCLSIARFGAQKLQTPALGGRIMDPEKRNHLLKYGTDKQTIKYTKNSA